MELKAAMKDLKKLVESQKSALDDKFKEEEKKMSKEAEEETAANREEPIKIKKEKNKLCNRKLFI